MQSLCSGSSTFAEQQRDCKDEEAEWARDQQLQLLWLIHLCRATLATAKMKKLSGPEISRFSLSGSSKQQCDCKDEEAEQARDL
jgi:hypothetical protein